jgi:hypothetical protein
MWEVIIGFLGLFVGLLLVHISPEEFKPGKKYFLILFIVSAIALWVIMHFSYVWWLYLIGIILGMLFSYEYIYLGVGAVYSGMPWLYGSILFIFGLGYGSYFKEDKKRILISAGLFLVTLFLLFLDYNLISLAAGGLIGSLVMRIKNLKKAGL